MQKNYTLYSGTKKIGTFSLMNNGKKKEVRLIDGLTNLMEIPIHFWNLYQQGIRVFDTNTVDFWINDRVIPSGRQDIDEILTGMGLGVYSELGIFMYHRGRCVMDNFYIKDSSGLEHYKFNN